MHLRRGDQTRQDRPSPVIKAGYTAQGARTNPKLMKFDIHGSRNTPTSAILAEPSQAQSRDASALVTSQGNPRNPGQRLRETNPDRPSPPRGPVAELGRVDQAQTGIRDIHDYAFSVQKCRRPLDCGCGCSAPRINQRRSKAPTLVVRGKPSRRNTKEPIDEIQDR
jgi:hypothetical protein